MTRFISSDPHAGRTQPGATEAQPLPDISLARAARLLSAGLGVSVLWKDRADQAELPEGSRSNGGSESGESSLSTGLLPAIPLWSAEIVVNDISAAPEGLREELAALDASAAVTIPLFDAEGITLGAMGVFSPAPRTWTPESLEAIRDVATLVGVEIESRRDTLHDRLTGLPNRALFMHRIEHAVERARRHRSFRFAVLALDLDRFSLVNESLGSRAGDQLLSHVAERMNGCVRGEDMVARIGNDEIGVLLESLSDNADASRVTERMHRALADAVLLDDGEVFTSASIGVVLSSSGLESAETFLQRARLAMARAKRGGRARSEMYDRGMQERATQRLRAETELRRAIDRDEFELFYQPMVDLESGQIVELEALLRWRHPEKGIVPPLDFIPLAEETGLIVPIGSWVLATACRQLKKWHEIFPRERQLSVSVNVAAKQLAMRDFSDHVAEILEIAQLDPKTLKLEITESSLIDNPERTRETLVALRELGVRVYLDDFGTGWSSLRYLHELPLDAIKIDRSFVARMEQGATHLQLVHTVRALALNIGVQAVAEGVENPVQLQLLRSLGCDAAQGFLFSRPIPRREMERVLKEDPRW